MTITQSERDLQTACDRLVGREVHHCVSFLISELAKLEWDAKEDELYPVLTKTVWACGKCDGEYPDEDEAEDCCAPEEEDGKYLCHGCGGDFDDATSAIVCCSPEERTNEAYEHWIVSSWLSARLADHGEMVGEVMGLTIWGRCTTGQAISMDGVIREIQHSIA